MSVMRVRLRLAPAVLLVSENSVGIAGARKQGLLWDPEGSKKQIMEWQSFADCELWLQRGTLGYMAPELMGYKHDEDESNSRHPVTMAVDIYSFGLLLWAIITGEKPRMHDESLRKPRHAFSQTWRLPNIALCWSLHLTGTDMRLSVIASWILYIWALACCCRPSPRVRSLRWGMSPCAGPVWASSYSSGCETRF